LPVLLQYLKEFEAIYFDWDLKLIVEQ
jgi:hypothetical protein